MFSVILSYPKFLLILIICFTVGCAARKNDIPPGVAISFDDRFIDEWYKLRPLFKKYNAHVTFYITQFDSLSSDEIQKLHALQQDGHEIGCHGAIHTNSVQYVKDRSLQDYIADEIDPCVIPMKQHGFIPTSFAHPGGVHNSEIDSELLKQFKLLRDVAIIERSVWKMHIRWNIAYIPTIYYKFDGDQTVDALLIDQGAGLTMKEVQKALTKTKADNYALMLFGHKPFYVAPRTGEYGFQVSLLDSILNDTQQLGLKTYTMSELVDLSSSTKLR